MADEQSTPEPGASCESEALAENQVECEIHGVQYTIEWQQPEWKVGPVCFRCYAESQFQATREWQARQM